MRILILGGGGREHALAWKLSQSPQVSSIHCMPGNGGISEIADCVDINANDSDAVIKFARNERIDLVVVGPENPLASGIVNAFEEKTDIPIFGPRKEGALLETSKVFAKELMWKNNIPTAPFKVFSEYSRADEYLRQLDPPYVVKADGLAAGKGAYVIQTAAEGRAVVKNLMLDHIHGDAGKRVVIEGFLRGIEASYLAFTDGKTILPLIPSQDHKNLLDGDQGPNTGGMGAYAPIPFISEELKRDIDDSIMAKMIESLSNEGVVYRGVLYGGLMLSDEKPYVIEFNARLGDPETQPILFKMESDILPVIMACVEGRLAQIEDIHWKSGVSVCVVLVSKGYPNAPEKGKLIRGLESLQG